jgi:DNA-binding NarL/FixJ family response regulator
MYRVTWEVSIEAASPEEAAMKAYLLQKGQAAASVRYRVSDRKQEYEDVGISSDADIELLTDREREVAELLVKGASNGDIAQELKITPRTVKAHISHMFEKFNVGNRVKLATKLILMENETRRDHATV